MKTITLDEESYGLLKSWKKGSKESFSTVIKRIVPAPGTLGAFLNFTENFKTVDFEKNEKMEKAIEDRSEEKTNPWI